MLCPQAWLTLESRVNVAWTFSLGQECAMAAGQAEPVIEPLQAPSQEGVDVPAPAPDLATESHAWHGEAQHITQGACVCRVSFLSPLSLSEIVPGSSPEGPDNHTGESCSR